MKKLSPNALKQYREQFNTEYDLISKCGFSRYFLIVQDLVEYCKEKQILTGPGRGCFLPDNIVCLSNGEKKKIKDININDEIISHKKTKEKVTNKFKYDIKEQIFKFKVGDSLISCTFDHKILTTKGWRKAYEIKVGDKIIKVC